MKARRAVVLAVLLFLAALAVTAGAGAEEAENITPACKFKFCSGRGNQSVTDGKYTSYWESAKDAHPWITISTDTPAYGLYLCFQNMPDTYVIQVEKGGSWATVAEGDTRYHHILYPLEGAKHIRVYASASGKKTTMGFNEVFVFGAGDVPDWVQRWEPTPEKAEILFLATHPDDELLFLGGALAWYGVEQQRSVAVAYLTKSNTTRWSEALNGLWTLGIRNYPIFGEWRDCYSRSGQAKDAYKDTGGKSKIQGWVTELYRQLKPEVVVTQDLNGEYGHPQHKMVADAATAAYSLAADPEQYPETAEIYGVWQVKKLYLHLYGDEADKTQFNWDIPLDSLGGMTANEKAEEAYAQHVTQKGQGQKFNGKMVKFSVAEYGGKRYPNTWFGLWATEVGPDVRHDDFLENIDGIEDGK